MGMYMGKGSESEQASERARMENLVSRCGIYVAACIIWRAPEFDRNPPTAAGFESQLSLFVKDEMMNKWREPMGRAAF